jgi:hypothetical protein
VEPEIVFVPFEVFYTPLAMSNKGFSRNALPLSSIAVTVVSATLPIYWQRCRI